MVYFENKDIFHALVLFEQSNCIDWIIVCYIYIYTVTDQHVRGRRGLDRMVETSWIYYYICNQCLSPLKLWVRTPLMARCTRYNIMWYSFSVACGRSVVFTGYSGFLHQ